MATLGKETKGRFDHGSKSLIGATALQLTTSTVTADKGVLIKAAAANGGGIVYVGNSDVTAGGTDATNGYPVAAGEEVVIPVDTPSSIYVIGSTTNLEVFFLVL